MIHLIGIVAVFQLAPIATPVQSAPRVERSGMSPAAAATAVENDNRRAAGTLRDRVLSIRMEARTATWRPESRQGSLLSIFAFAEDGKPPTVPGPMIRVTQGTQIHAIVRNNTGKPLLMRGFEQRPSKHIDSVDLAPGETREFRFFAGVPGTYYYYGRTEGNRRGLGGERDSQLAGAIVVDSPSEPQTPDRVFVITGWFHWIDTSRTHPAFTEHYFVNGRSWPYTEQIVARVGDSIRWRMVNASGAPHPMHLHGFFFDVLARGNAARDSVFLHGSVRKVVTESMLAGTTMLMAWQPDRPGNWLFHCHFASHVAQIRRVDEVSHSTQHPQNHALEGMAALVLGIHVRDAPHARQKELATGPTRSLSVFVDERANGFGSRPAFGFVTGNGAPPAADSIVPGGSPIFLTRGQPAEITVINQTHLPVSVHWHGMELQSYYDGVSGWSGSGDKVAPSVQHGQSFIVRFTPPRAGTFIYHTHDDSHEELSSGMYGPLIVLNPGETHDTDQIFVMAANGPGGNTLLSLNGLTDPTPLELKQNTSYRLRFIDITPDGFEWFTILGADGKPVVWRPVAKDGADLPAQLQTPVAAENGSMPGETYDFAFTPQSAGQLTLRITNYEFPFAGKVTKVRVIVR